MEPMRAGLQLSKETVIDGRPGAIVDCERILTEQGISLTIFCSTRPPVLALQSGLIQFLCVGVELSMSSEIRPSIID